MTTPAVISGQLVDVRNIATDKSIRLSIHVPAELAAAVIECFGWPTGVDPVPVAIARLAEGKDGDAPERKSTNTDTRPRVASEQPRGAKSPAQMAGWLCKEPKFHAFLKQEYGLTWRIVIHSVETEEEHAASVVRALCQVASRKDIGTDEESGNVWAEIIGNYRAWEAAPRAGL